MQKHLHGLVLLCTLSGSVISAESDKQFFSFWHGILKDFERVGAIAQCSSYVAKEMSKHIDTIAFDSNHDNNQPLYVLEVGGGCGALTSDIEAKLNQLDKAYILDVVEIDPEYCEILSHKFANNPRVRIHCVDASTWNPGYQYDIIISTLPFTSLPSDLVIKVVEQFKKLIKKGGFVSYLEYIFLARVKLAYLNVKGLFTIDTPKKEFEEKINVLSHFKQEFGIETKNVLLNVMPAHVHHLKMYV